MLVLYDELITRLLSLAHFCSEVGFGFIVTAVGVLC